MASWITFESVAAKTMIKHNHVGNRLMKNIITENIAFTDLLVLTARIKSETIGDNKNKESALENSLRNRGLSTAFGHTTRCNDATPKKSYFFLFRSPFTDNVVYFLKELYVEEEIRQFSTSVKLPHMCTFMF